jgi:hypothetical protein
MADNGEIPPAGQDDLGGVLRGIGMGRLASTREKLANTRETRQFLEIGVELLREDMLRHTGPDFDTGLRSRLFESVSRERILHRAAVVEPGHPLSVNMFRHRWDRKDRYTEDLISYIFRLAPQRCHLDAMDAHSDRLMRLVGLEQFVRTMAEAEVTMLLEDPLLGVQAMIQSALPSHPRVREFCQAQNDQLLPRWARLYEKVAGGYGLVLRPGRTWLDVAVLFNTVIDGELAWTRVAGRPRLSNGDHVLAGAILAMLPSLFDGVPRALTRRCA